MYRYVFMPTVLSLLIEFLSPELRVHPREVQQDRPVPAARFTYNMPTRTLPAG